MIGWKTMTTLASWAHGWDGGWWDGGVQSSALYDTTYSEYEYKLCLDTSLAVRDVSNNRLHNSNYIRVLVLVLVSYHPYDMICVLARFVVYTTLPHAWLEIPVL